MTRCLPRRWPFWPSLMVALAVVAMLGLGIWQVQRAGGKKLLIAQVRANPGLPAISFPHLGPVDRSLLFRRSSVMCLRVVGWRSDAGRTKDGRTGFRQIAECATGAEGPGALIALGVAPRPGQPPHWSGGPVRGWIGEEPDRRTLTQRLTGPHVPLRPMLIAESAPVPDLAPLAPPNADAIPDNHLFYAIQWFAFAAIAALIYVLALARRQAAGQDGNDDGKQGAAPGDS